MPRMRNIRDLIVYKADKHRKYAHIDSLCRKTIDWDLIERHYPDMMRVEVSVKASKMTPSTILRRLGSESTKNLQAPDRRDPRHQHEAVLSGRSR